MVLELIFIQYQDSCLVIEATAGRQFVVCLRFMRLKWIFVAIFSLWLADLWVGNLASWRSGTVGLWAACGKLVFTNAQSLPQSECLNAWQVPWPKRVFKQIKSTMNWTGDWANDNRAISRLTIQLIQVKGGARGVFYLLLYYIQYM